MSRRNLVITAVLLITLSIAPAQNTAPHFPAVTDWKLAVDEAVYTPSNLWDVIDGAADLFLEYNFVDLHIARYQRAGDVEIKVEVYRHKTAVDAFGMYSQERYPDYHFIDIGTQGYSEKGILNFLCGEYYVKISTIQSSEEVQDGLRAIGRSMEKGLNRSKSWPVLLSMFPTTGKQSNGEQYIAKNFLGYSFFNGAYTASYSGKKSVKAFIMRFGSPDEARKTVDSYLAGLRKENVSTFSNGGTKVRDPHSGNLIFALDRNTIYGLVGDTDADSGSLFTELGRNLSGMK